MTVEEIKDKLPYDAPFMFVDALTQVNANGAVGNYTFHRDADFYNGHFANFPVTPGVLLTECCAQIGLVSLGIYLLKDTESTGMQVALTNSEMEFMHPVFPGETVKVTSEKVYFRFQKLKCKVKMYNEAQTLVCRGTLSGMLKNTAHG